MAEVRIEVVYATPANQSLLEISVPARTRVREAIAASGLLEMYPELDVDDLPVGIFGQRVTGQTTVAEGDRIEIYRPLVMDPKEARRQRAKKGAS